MPDDSGPRQIGPREQMALREYGKWRPRIGRGVRWAGTAGVLSGLAQKASLISNKGRLLPVAAATAGLAAGIGDKMLEEHVARSRKLQRLTGNAFKKEGSVPGLIDGRGPSAQFTESGELSNMDEGAGIVSRLFSEKARLTRAALQQLTPLFPEAAANDGFARSIGMPQPVAGHRAAIRNALKK